MLNLSKDDLDLYLDVVNLPNVINNLINQELYAQATKAICTYHAKVRQKINIESTDTPAPKILKLVDKEIIGVLQQKLVKLIAIKLQNSYKADSNGQLTKHLLILLRNLLKASPPEAEIHIELQYKQMDDIVFSLLLAARS